MAMPTSARASAGASLMPSPTIATLWPCACSLRTSRSLSWGSTSATASSMPVCARMASAAARWSPVSITTRMPMRLSAATAPRLVGLTTSATASTPSACPAQAKYIGVLPARASASPASRRPPGCTPRSCKNARLPARQAWPSTSASMPRPGTDAKRATGNSAAPRSCAYAVTASASGCSEACSIDAATASSRASSTPGAVRTSVTRGRPSVIVPVLSSTTVFTACAVSSASADLNRMPYSAPLPVPTMIATGVARPSAHGQEMTSTAMPNDSAPETGSPSASHTSAVTTAMAMTTGTNTPLMRSASLAIGAFELPASSTRRMICESVVSSPTRVARTFTNPRLLIVAALTASPSPRSTGMLSPVSADWSTLVCPLTITPSTGMLPPGRTSTMSPTATCSSGTVSSRPSRSTVAVLGRRSISRRIASPVLPLERVSRNLPSVIRARIMAADSKYRSIEKRLTRAASPWPSP